ncbi:TniQ family protein [Hylemonella gracilis]|uniref:HTH cro/C1-type domain-containing protein n=1 Tax=Hylemonella gracilis ATCC 19624 TaxID=887062 RepID=F3KSN6_9BURK|nr:TniQ family protein [Hylemonella gracilis]EGI77105.1 hypothetical protein HGR_07326 [Hylemonella gracilis ATCC 19624]
MTEVAISLRSTLHALDPYGRGTSEVESLLSYFCRLAVSHSTSTLSLSRMIAERFQHEVEKNFDWHERHISGLRESALTWSSALSAMTSVPGLDELTFLPWKAVVSQNGLSMVSKGQFCPVCFAEDCWNGRGPYFRLAWESRAMTVCLRHSVRLIQYCPSCGKDNVRHAAAFVVPGWCTKCGEFLGRDADQLEAEAISPEELWQARQVGDLLVAQGRHGDVAQRSGFIDALIHIIGEMDGGMPSMFAARTGIAKSTLHHWLHEKGTPTLEMSLNIAARCGISLPKLLLGDLRDWEAPRRDQQLALLPSHDLKRRSSARALDWDQIERELQNFLELPTPISVLEAARRLDVEARQLYLRVNRTTRHLGERWKRHLAHSRQANLQTALPHLQSLGRELLAEGHALTRRDVAARIPPEVMSSVPRLFEVLRNVQERLIAEQADSRRDS